jgi:hypothetical protein
MLATMKINSDTITSTSVKPLASLAEHLDIVPPA